MRVRVFPRFNTDDFRTAPDWFKGAFLDPLNQIIDALNPLFANGIDIDTNLTAERQTVKVSHNVPVALRMRVLKTLPRLVRLGYAGGHIGTAAITSYGADGTVSVTVFFHTLPPGPVDVVLVLEP